LVLKLQQCVQKQSVSQKKRKLKPEKEVTQDSKTHKLFFLQQKQLAESASILDFFQDRKPWRFIQGIELFVTICKTAWRTHTVT